MAGEQRSGLKMPGTDRVLVADWASSGRYDGTPQGNGYQSVRSGSAGYKYEPIPIDYSLHEYGGGSDENLYGTAGAHQT